MPEPENSAPGPTEPDSLDDQSRSGDAATAAELERLRTLVRTLQQEQVELLAARADALQAENTRIRSEVSTAPFSSQQAPATERAVPPYIARALIAVESDLADMETFTAVGNDNAAAQAKVAAATRTCLTLQRLCDDDAFHSTLMTMQEHAQEMGATVASHVHGSTDSGTFRDVEVQLLELIGLSRALAERHVDSAIAAYDGTPAEALARIQNPMRFLADLRSIRDASCELKDVLSLGVRRQQSRTKWRKILTFGLGGTAIVAANALGTAILGPAGVAASGAVGSAAVGVAVQPVD